MTAPQLTADSNIPPPPPTTTNADFLPYDHDMELTLNSDVLGNRGMIDNRVNEKANNNVAMGNTNIRNFMLISKQARVDPGLRPVVGNRGQVSRMLPHKENAMLTDPLAQLMLHHASSPMKSRQPVQSIDARSGIVSPPSIDIAKKSQILRPDIGVGHDSLGHDDDDGDDSYNNAFDRTNLLRKDNIPQVMTLHSTTHDATDGKTDNTLQNKMTNSILSLYNDGQTNPSKTSAVSKPGLTDADLLGLTYNDMIELGMKDDASFMDAGPKDDAKTVSIGDLDSKVPANVVRAAIARVTHAQEREKARLASSRGSSVASLLNRPSAKTTDRMSRFIISASGQNGMLAPTDRRLSQVNINSNTISGNPNNKNLPIFSTQDDGMVRQESDNVYPVNGASDEVTAENLATIFNEIDDDSVEMPSRGHELKKDIIPGSNTAPKLEDNTRDLVQRPSPRTLETPLHGESQFNNVPGAARDTVQSNNVASNNEPLKSDLFTTQTDGQSQGKQTTYEDDSKKSVVLRKGPPRKFNLASLHFGLHNGNLVE